MQVLKRGIMPDGTPIQIEDWSKDYTFRPNGSTLASYPKSKANHKGHFAPKEGEKYRFQFSFTTEVETEKAFTDLLEGAKSLSDFKENFSSKRDYLNCI